MELSLELRRPRNVDWKRAAALLYGDWGTSKAYVIGAAFLSMRYASMPIILAVCALTGVVGAMYMIVCRYFPEGGGVYSAARMQSRLLASIGGLLLVADLTVTAALSGWSALTYLGVPPPFVQLATIGVIVTLGAVNFYGPKHSGTLATALAIPTVLSVIAILCLSAPHFVPLHTLLTFRNAEPGAHHLTHYWVSFVSVILALSGVEAIANLTGVMKLDKGASETAARVGRTAFKSIFVVAIEVVFGTALMGWAMLSLPQQMENELLRRWEEMLRVLAEQYGTMALGPVFGQWFGLGIAIVVALLLLSAVNTAINALIGVMYMMGGDGEMPHALTRLNPHGVPIFPLIIGTALPVAVLTLTSNFETLMHLYAIGVVGAIAVNLGSCASNRKLGMKLYERALMAATFVVLCAVELTLAKTKPEALFFVVCILGVGLAFRAYSHKLSGLKTLTVTRDIADVVSAEALARLRPKIKEGQRIMVAARGVTPVLRFAVDQARLMHATLCVLYVKEVAVFLGDVSPTARASKWQNDPHAAAIMSLMLKLGRENGIDVLPIYAVSADPAMTILDLTATLGVDYLLLGAAHRSSMAKLLKGDVVEKVTEGLPEDIQMIIYG
jgi:amino acid transporter/nucleotide-binding universal stress UspA family protein